MDLERGPVVYLVAFGLDSAQRVRMEGWRAITQVACIRTPIHASMERQMDLTDSGNERQWTERLSAADEV